MEEMTENVLPWSEVPKLMKFYENAGIHHYSAYLVLENVHRWHQSFPESDSFIICPDGKINEYGTFMIVCPLNEDMVDLIFEDLNPNPKEIKSFLYRCICQISERWMTILFGIVKERYWSVLEETAFEAKFSKVQSSFSKCYYMNKDLVKKFSVRCPEEVYIAPVKEEHADLINSLWPLRFEDSVHVVRAIIRRNGGLGLYLKENDELVSWGLRGLYNGPGNIQTVENHLRKGLGSIATIAISKFVAEKGIHPLFFARTTNVPALTLYAKLGFSVIEQVQFALWEKR